MQNDELRSTKAQAEEAFAKYSDLYNFAPVGLFTLGNECRILEVNLSGADLLGAERSMVINSSFKGFVSAESRSLFNDFVKAVFETEAKQTAEIVLRKYESFKDKIHARIEGTVPWNSAEKHLKIAVTDISARKVAEDELKKARDELQKANFELMNINRILHDEIVERIKIEEELKASKEAAEEATRIKSEFMANMSHEIRTPMNAIIGLADLMLDEPLDPGLRDNLETIKKSADDLMGIINDILDFSKIEKGKMELECQPFELRKIIDESLDLLSLSAREKGLALKTEIDKSAPETVIGDATRLRQVLINLLGNAIKFTKQGGIKTGVKSKQLSADRYELQFSVQDTGIGISEELTDRLFQPFTQADASISKRYGGTGLGLAISKRLVELMGGKIWAESTPNQGSIFHFTIIVDSTSAVPVKATRTSSDESGKNRVNKNLRILLAEDNLVNRKMALLMLKKLGFKADVVADGTEVLQALELQPYDLVLMDVQMPRMNSIEVTKEIRRRWSTGPRITALTAYAMEGDREICLDAGMDGYLAKPINKADLEALLNDS